MKKIFLSILFFLLFLLYGVANVFAEINVTRNLEVLYRNTSRVEFTFTSTQDTFTKAAKNYLLIVWPPGADSNNNSFQGKETFYVTKIDDRRVKATIAPAGLKDDGMWTYKLMYLPHPDAGLDSLKNSEALTTGTYYVNTPGVIDPITGKSVGIPAIRVDNTIWSVDRLQNIYIVNAVAGQTYSLWFNKDVNILAEVTPKKEEIQAKNKYGDENVFTAFITAPKTPSESLKTLCMTPAKNTLGAVFLSCDYYISGIKITAKDISPVKQDCGPNKNTPCSSVISNKAGVPLGDEPMKIDSVCPKDTCETAIGEISTKPTEFVKSIFGILLSLSGGVALILIIISGYRLMTSQGNPEKVQAAREQLTSAIIGLVFIIFSLTILQIIGVDILRIPGLK